MINLLNHLWTGLQPEEMNEYNILRRWSPGTSNSTTPMLTWGILLFLLWELHTATWLSQRVKALLSVCLCMCFLSEQTYIVFIIPLSLNHKVFSYGRLHNKYVKIIFYFYLYLKFKLVETVWDTHFWTNSAEKLKLTTFDPEIFTCVLCGCLIECGRMWTYEIRNYIVRS